MPFKEGVTVLYKEPYCYTANRKEMINMSDENEAREIKEAKRKEIAAILVSKGMSEEDASEAAGEIVACGICVTGQMQE